MISDILYRLNNIWPKLLKNPNARGFFISALLDVNQPRHSLPTAAYQCSRRKVMATIMQISLGENDSRGRRNIPHQLLYSKAKNGKQSYQKMYFDLFLGDRTPGEQTFQNSFYLSKPTVHLLHLKHREVEKINLTTLLLIQCLGKKQNFLKYAFVLKCGIFMPCRFTLGFLT